MLAAILIAAYLCTNPIEILGDRLGLSQGGVGSVLAAVVTLLGVGIALKGLIAYAA